MSDIPEPLDVPWGADMTNRHHQVRRLDTNGGADIDISLLDYARECGQSALDEPPGRKRYWLERAARAASAEAKSVNPIDFRHLVRECQPPRDVVPPKLQPQVEKLYR